MESGRICYEVSLPVRFKSLDMETVNIELLQYVLCINLGWVVSFGLGKVTLGFVSCARSRNIRLGYIRLSSGRLATTTTVDAHNINL
jgi:hypothetical protein